MYFEIDETHPDITPVGSVMSWREGVLLSVIVHLVFVIISLTAPNWLARFDLLAPKPQPVPQQPQEKTQFVFVQPKLDLKALKPPERAEASDMDRQAATPRPQPRPQSPLPYLRGTVGMALDGPDTAGSQFFITLSPQPHLDGKYTVFGRVVNGLDLLDQVAQWDVIERVRIWDGTSMVGPPSR